MSACPDVKVRFLLLGGVLPSWYYPRRSTNNSAIRATQSEHIHATSKPTKPQPPSPPTYFLRFRPDGTVEKCPFPDLPKIDVSQLPITSLDQLRRCAE